MLPYMAFRTRRYLQKLIIIQQVYNYFIFFSRHLENKLLLYATFFAWKQYKTLPYFKKKKKKPSLINFAIPRNTESAGKCLK